MAGRGRGGKTSSLTQEQLQTLGCVGKDMPQVQTAPPPTYPPLMSKPVKLETTAAQSYQILWKEGFLNYMRDSPYYLQTLEKTKINKSILSYTQKNADETEFNKIKAKAEFDWSRMPSELQMANKKRKLDLKSKIKDIKKTKTGNINDRLKQLEEKERTDNEKEKTNKDNSDSEQEIEEEGEIIDDEMDEENDYGNSYFDNGEAFNEEDDNLDDGPVY